jgi:hypothetical protein
VTPSRQELVELAETLPEAALPDAVAALRLLRSPQSETWPPPWFGSIDLDGSVAENLDGWLAEGFGRA